MPYRRVIGLCILAAVCAAQPFHNLAGRLVPPTPAAVSIHGVATPYKTTKLAGESGRFQFPGLEAGSYTLAVFIPGRGEARTTIEVGPSTPSTLVLKLDELSFIEGEVLRRQHSISAKQLSVPDKARREFDAAQKDQSKRDFTAAIKHLERAVVLAPQFAAAWNNLGTIAYQTRQYPRAEQSFRKALEADPEAFEPLVNLGGVLLNLNKIDEAWNHNLFAVLKRPNDALANAQLGMTYFQMGNSDLAEKYLKTAQRIDPAHFSHPQLLLAEIHLRKGDGKAAAEDLEDFLKHHPDWPQAVKMRLKIDDLRGLTGPR